MDELDFYDPDDDEEYGLALAEPPKRKRKRKRNPSNPDIAIAPILLLVAGYAGWCWWASARKNLPWNWQPWKGIALGRRLPVGRTLRQNDPRAFDAAVEKMMAPAFSVVEQDLWRRPSHDALEKEVVTFIEP